MTLDRQPGVSTEPSQENADIPTATSLLETSSATTSRNCSNAPQPSQRQASDPQMPPRVAQQQGLKRCSKCDGSLRVTRIDVERFTIVQFVCPKCGYRWPAGVKPRVSNALAARSNLEVYSAAVTANRGVR